jgi:MSHA pilin protein MshD
MNGCRGLTLVELVITIAVVAIAAAAVLAGIASTSVSSARAMAQFQATAIAEAYLEEILLRPFADPDGTDGETARADLDDVDDYDGLADAQARDQYGNAIAGLENYGVAVSVQGSNALPSVPATAALLVNVTVQPPTGASVTLSAYRTDYN